MAGLINVSNVLAAAATALAVGASLDGVGSAAEVTTVQGRMEPVECGQPFRIFIDFAHTPQALESVLRSVRDQTPGRLMVMFGHSGGRDAHNRRPMGSVGARLADFAVVTSDNPLHEDPAAIAAEIALGAKAAGARIGTDVVITLDRGEAIRELVNRAAPGDTLVFAGKGHERYQMFANRTAEWSDAQEVRKALAERNGTALRPTG
jgi:UDP-N-acetylmuramoyl-L-alanyl-D-glutamate--2,6-diaminopimelate ligase